MSLAANTLTAKRCQPCEKGTPPLSAGEAASLARLVPGWELVDAKLLRRQVKCRDFLDAVELIRKIASVAEAEDHHPDLHLTGYRRLTIELATHAIGGLSENDFILAAKLSPLVPGEASPKGGG